MATSVSFPSNGLRLAGLLFTPENRTGECLPAVVVSHPGGGVKEQTASIYAQRLADKGYAALVFDAAYQGESEGEPRFLIGGASHIDLYDVDQYVTPAVEKLDEFFGKGLAG
ncbi:alpha/beta hydrolase [Nocardia beijingensis]|uniref:alpha/beta hydrolase n=1 Tax=Nocardia beijingensis TaxID=95162 RepID=UPI0033D09635